MRLLVFLHVPWKIAIEKTVERSRIKSDYMESSRMESYYVESRYMKINKIKKP